MSSVQKMLTLFIGVGLLFALGAIAVSAAPAIPGNVMNDIPATALYVDGTSQTIGANSSLWYKFDSSTSDVRNDPNLTLLTLTNGTNSGVGFDVYAGSQIAAWWDATPVGRGTSQANLGVQSENLTWSGMFNGNGVQYIRVNNTNPFATTFTLHQSVAGIGN